MKIQTMSKVLVLILLLCTGKIGIGNAFAQKMDKAAFYAAMTSGKMEDIEKELAVLTESEQGYAGALIIRKAAIVPKAKEKLKLFKEGRIKLETALQNEPDNAEYHFLRLSIEEHAPKIVKYKADLQADKAFVIKHFDKLSPVVQRAVKDYSKDSKILRPEEL
jgi:hypothetical protein